MIAKYFNPYIKINRKSYIKRMLAASFLWIAMLLVGKFIVPEYSEYITPNTLLPLFISLSVSVYLQIIASINRTRDIGISPYWNFLFLLPAINLIYAVYLTFKKGEAGNQKYDEKSGYELISNEINTSTYNNGLWLKAYQIANGDDVKTKLEYIKLRFAELNKEANDSIAGASNETTCIDAKRQKILAIAICSIAVVAFIPYIGMHQAIKSNEALSGDVYPLPFSFASRFEITNCAANNFPQSLTLEEIEFRIQKTGSVVPHLQLVEYYLYGKDKDFNKAHEILEKRIKEKTKYYSADLRLMGNLYECGYSVPKNIDKAISFYEQAEAYRTLAGIYTSGRDIPENLEKSFFYLEKSAENHNYKADLASLYYYGLGTKKDLRESFRLLKHTIDFFEKNNTTADIEDHFNIGLMYYYGFGTLKNNKKALKYLEQTIEMKDESEYTKDLKSIAIELSAQIRKK